MIKQLLIGTSITAFDRECVLMSILDCDRSWLYAHDDTELTDVQLQEFNDALKRLSNDEPLAHVIGHHDFMGYRFIVSNQTLIPRPCTETLVELTEDFLVLPHNFTQEIDSEIVAIGRILKPATGVINIVADIGTGSGCIALSLALRQPILTVIATDVSETALEVAASNALLHNLKRVTFNCSSLLEALNNIKEPFIVVSNPPYIPSTITLDASVANFEPHKALFAEHDGLGVIRPLIEQMIEHPYCIGFCMECRADQVYAIDDMLR